MPKKQRSVWEPQPVIIAIGGVEYNVVPQPLRRYLEFEERLRELIAGLGPGSGLVGKGEAEGGEVEETELDEALGLPEEAPRLLVEQGVEAIYEVLRCAIPELDIEDVWNSPEPELEHALETCLKMNGGRWAQALISDFFQPLLPALHAWLMQLLMGGGATPTATETETGQSGETQ